MHPRRFAGGLTAALLAVAPGCRSKEGGSGADPSATPATNRPALSATVTVGRMTPLSVDGLPDWALSGIDNCYTDGLLANPAQAGEMSFTVRPPPADGPVLVELKAKGSLDEDFVACAKRALGTIHHYGGGRGRAQREVTATIRLDPVALPSPELPTEAALRSVLDDRYAHGGVVRVIGLTVHGVHHRKSSPDLLRDFFYTVELAFVVDGYEARCHHLGSYKVFSREEHHPRGAGHVCESQARKAGERTNEESSMYFRQTSKGWQVGWEDAYYCGDRRCTSAP